MHLLSDDPIAIPPFTLAILGSESAFTLASSVYQQQRKKTSRRNSEVSLTCSSSPSESIRHATPKHDKET